VKQVIDTCNFEPISSELRSVLPSTGTVFTPASYLLRQVNSAVNGRVLLLIVLGLSIGLAFWNAWPSRFPSRTEAQIAAQSTVPPVEPLFEDGTARAGIKFFLDPGPLELYEVPQVTGSGCAFLDFDQDGSLDIFLVNQAGGAGYAEFHDAAEPAAPGPTSRLYRQQSDGTFTDVTRGSGLDIVGVGMGVAVGDVNNDGFPDLCVSYFRGTRLFLNRRDGTFADVTQFAGIDNPHWGTSCVFFDFDRDGWLDLFVANYADYHVGRRCPDRNGYRDFCGPNDLVGVPHKLFRNESSTLNNSDATNAELSVRFRDVSVSSGIARHMGRGLGVVSADFDGDRWPDLFVTNDGEPNFLWTNQHDGTFVEQAVLRGAAYDLTGTTQANMGIAIGDVDSDGRLDILVTHFDGEMNALYLNKSNEGFEESAASTGLGTPSLPYTSWGTAFFDVDHDGDLDLAVVNGGVKRGDASRDLARLGRHSPAAAVGWEQYAEPNQFFLNDGTGHFVEVPQATEPFCARPEIGRGLAIGDVDNDGDLDVLVSSLAGPARLFVNVARKQGHWLQIRVVEPAFGGRDAYGAVVVVTAQDRRWMRSVNPAFSYLSSNDPRVHFGLGNVDAVDAISVIWADGVAEIFPGGGVDRHLVLRRGEGRFP
jgi:hypothetical protein